MKQDWQYRVTFGKQADEEGRARHERDRRRRQP